MYNQFMFGMNLVVKNENISIGLRPAKLDDVPIISTGLSSFKVNIWTTLTGAPTLEIEKEWYEKMSKSEKDFTWILSPSDSDEAIGVVSLNDIDNIGSCTQGLAIWNQKWWGKGVATLANLACIWFACDQINRNTIRAYVRSPNTVARKAAEKIGFTVWGIQPGVFFRDGIYVDTCHLLFVNPNTVNQIFPKGIPIEFQTGIDKAQKSLELARKSVEY